ncbi:MAG: hypothetical protein MJZ31_04410 [Bacteroidales bacterium]|nr:hypothetical protein [Bacteroidales bacterium]
MRHSYIYIISVLLGCLSFLEGCGKRGEAYNILEQADSALLAGEDSVAFEMLTAVEDSVVEEMGEAEGALYAVLVNQVLDRMDYELDDSLAQAAVEYYGNNGARDDYHEGLAYYYMGHILMRKNDISAIGWYSEAKECFKKSGDLRYEFLCWNYMGYMSDLRRDNASAIEFYKKGVKIAKLYQSNLYLCSEYAALAYCYSLSCMTDSMNMYLDSMELYKEYYYELYNHEYYRIKALSSLCTKDYRQAILFCDSAELQGGDNGVNYVRVEGLIGMGEYNKALEVLYRKAERCDIYQQCSSYEQLSKVYSALGIVDSIVYYNKLYLSTVDVLDSLESNVTTAVSELSNRHKHSKQQRLITESKYSTYALYLVFALIGVSLLLKKSHNDGYTQAEYAKAFTTINSKVKIVMSGEVEDLKCKEQVHAIIEESIPSAIQTIMNKCPYLDEKDAVSLVMYWANLSSSMIGRVVFLSRGGAYKKLQNAIRRIEEEFGTKNMDEIIKNIFS